MGCSEWAAEAQVATLGGGKLKLIRCGSRYRRCTENTCDRSKLEPASAIAGLAIMATVVLASQDKDRRNPRCRIIRPAALTVPSCTPSASRSLLPVTQASISCTALSWTSTTFSWGLSWLGN